ncbi:DUF6607 family protein [Flavobacterium selenitireducens]|uniref:DUF6607 family protein n=1 Tax=Flavobacterium selenitireducens TaxID=2722704 RepID=UPI00168B9880|nr:DUF6607 family protein [Flavobacterium selenitireducens]MBD3583480.1 hypothetical protein [Flavobacterium selenitireducens]
MKSRILLSLSVLFTLGINAQDAKKKEDIKAIKAMCGCYEVEFNFAETFKYAKNDDYKPSPTKYEKGLELVELVEETPNKIVMQHLLQVSDTMVIKHWRQDWEFENTKLYDYEGENVWKFVTLPKDKVKGQWTQRVFQVDDSPRYEGSATWVHVDGRHYWTNVTDAPLPRREHTIRNDYNVLERTNTHEIVKDGWIHNQDNVKIKRTEGKDQLVAKEKGFDFYKKVDDSKCAGAKKYWAANQKMWKNVREKWATIFAQNKDLSLLPKVEGQSLFMALFDLKPTASKSETDAIIEKYWKKS